MGTRCTARATQVCRTGRRVARRNNPVLIGEAGVGKDRVRRRDRAAHRRRRRARHDLGAPCRAAGPVGDGRTHALPRRLRGAHHQGHHEIRKHADELVVFIDELHTVVGAGSSSEGGKDPALERRFQPILVPALSVEDTVAMSRLRQDITVEFAPAAVDWLAERGHQPEFGARPMRRTIQREVDNRLSALLLDGELRSGRHVVVDVTDGALDFAVTEQPTAVS